VNRTQYWIVTALAGLALVSMASSVGINALNRNLQAEIGTRQQYVQQSLQLETLYREIIRALAELGSRNNDQQVRDMLGKHGITYSAANPPAAPAPAAATAVKK
jgi:hypothetical protein